MKVYARALALALALLLPALSFAFTATAIPSSELSDSMLEETNDDALVDSALPPLRATAEFFRDTHTLAPSLTHPEEPLLPPPNRLASR